MKTLENLKLSYCKTPRKKVTYNLRNEYRVLIKMFCLCYRKLGVTLLVTKTYKIL